MLVSLPVLGSALTPGKDRNGEDVKLSRFHLLTLLSPPSASFSFLISLLWKLRLRGRALPPKSLVVYRAGLERSRCSFLHADWPNGV